MDFIKAIDNEQEEISHANSNSFYNSSVQRKDVMSGKIEGCSEIVHGDAMGQSDFD